MGIAPQPTITYARMAPIVLMEINSAMESLCALMHQKCHRIALSPKNQLIAALSLTRIMNLVPRMTHHCIKIFSALVDLLPMDAPLLIATGPQMIFTNVLTVKISLK